MGDFWVADLKANGELQMKACYSYDVLLQVPNCAELIGQLSGELWKAPDGFVEPLLAAPDALSARWLATADTAGLFSVRSGETLVSISVLASGKNADADANTLAALQQHLTTALHDTEHEPGFSLVNLAERPLTATINVSSPSSVVAKQVAALADRCFAASYFRYLRIV